MTALAAALALAGLAAGATPAADVVVRLRDAEVAGAEVVLGDVAEVEARGAAAGRAADLRRLPIGRAPAPGRTRRLDADYVKARVLAEGLAPEAVEVAGGDVEIRRPGRWVEGREVAAFVEAALLPHIPAGGRARIVREPAGVMLPLGEVSFVLAPPAAEAMRGTLQVPVEVSAGGATERVLVSVEVRRVEPVVVAARAIAPGRVLEAGDVRLEERDVTFVRGAAANAAAAVGRRARRPIAAGALVEPAALEAVPLVEAGDRVTIRSSEGGVAVSATGLARADGALGAAIPVRNDASRRIVTARVVGAGEVEAVR